MAISKLPADVGDENGETVIDERKIRIRPLPDLKKTVSKPLQASMDLPVSDVGLARRSVYFKAQDKLTYVKIMLYVPSPMLLFSCFSYEFVKIVCLCLGFVFVAMGS